MRRYVVSVYSLATISADFYFVDRLSAYDFYEALEHAGYSVQLHSDVDMESSLTGFNSSISKDILGFFKDGVKELSK